MKKHLIFIIGLLCSSVLSAQVDNGDFENWTNTIYTENPTGYFSNGLQAFFQSGKSNISRINGTIGDGVRIESFCDPQGTYGGLMANTDVFSGTIAGIPFSGQPDSFYCDLRYHVEPGDSASLQFIFTSAGTPIIFAEFYITGTSNTWQRRAFDIPPFVVNPDSVVFGVLNTHQNNSRKNSWIEIDEIAFSGPNQLPNSDFSMWTTTGSEDPDSWYSFNFAAAVGTASGPSVTKSTDKFQGNFSCRIETIKSGFGGGNDTLGVITNTGFDNFDSEVPEQSYDSSMGWRKFVFRYKYAPVGIDTGAVILIFSRWDTLTQMRVMVGTFFEKISPTSGTFQRYEIPYFFSASNQPDSFILAFSSSFIDDTLFSAQIGSVLTLDAVAFDFNSSLENLENSLNVKIFPNPVEDQYTIELISESNEEIEIQIMDGLGRGMASYKVDVALGLNKIRLDSRNEWSGIYFYKISQGEKSSEGKLFFE